MNLKEIFLRAGKNTFSEDTTSSNFPLTGSERVKIVASFVFLLSTFVFGVIP